MQTKCESPHEFRYMHTCEVSWEGRRGDVQELSQGCGGLDVFGYGASTIKNRQALQRA